jgi:hypothetical protein
VAIDTTNTSIHCENKSRRFRFVAIGILLCAGVFLRPSTVSSDQPVTLRVTPSISQAPAALLVRTSVEPDEQNRFLRVSVESADFYTSSELQLDGRQSPRVSIFKFRGVPGGSFEVKAELTGPNGRRALFSRSVEVIAVGK